MLDGIEIYVGLLPVVDISLSCSPAIVRIADVDAPQDPQGRLQFPAQAPIQVLNVGFNSNYTNSGRNCYMAFGSPLFLRLKFSESFSYV
jgi:hypothetical protein